MPDDELLDAAEQGSLDDPDELQRRIRRMLDSLKSAAFIENFGGQWLQLRNLAQVSPDAALFPECNNELRAAMKRETELFFRSDRTLRSQSSGIPRQRLHFFERALGPAL